MRPPAGTPARPPARLRTRMIAVIGEALIDLVAGADGCFAARPGGAGFNTARTIGRLGAAPAFLDRLSGDGFGRLLRSTPG